MARRTHAFIGVSVIGFGALLGAGARVSPASAAASNALVFAHPTWVDSVRLAGEPDISVGHDGRIYVSGPWGVTTDTSFLWRSEDGGTQFRQVQGAPGLQNPYAYRAGGDTEMHPFPPAGPLVTGEPAAAITPLYFANQNNLDSISCGVSTDAARTFTSAAGGQAGGTVCGGTVGADRQWIAETMVDPTIAANGGLQAQPIHYLWYDHFEVSGLQLGRSNDGVTYTLGPVYSGPSGSGNPGNIVADRTTGAVYVTNDTGNGVNVSYSADGGATLTNVQAVSSTAGNTNTDFTVLAIDTAGNLYLAYTVQNGTQPWQVFFTHTTGFTSVNNGTRTVPVAGATPAQWSTPVPITGPGSAFPTINYAVFPWITAGDPGRVDVAFYGTTQATGYDPNSQAAQWNTYVAQSLNDFTFPPTCAVGQSCAPTIAAVAEEPTHLSSICFNGIGCTGPPGVGGNRNMLDFFEITHDSNGMAVVTYNDDGNAMTAAWPGGPFDMVARQIGGPSVFTSIGSLNGLTPADTSGVDDPSGDGYYPTSDVSVPSLDLLHAGAVLKDASTLEASFTVNNLAGAVTQIPAAEGGIGVTYLLLWKYNDDVWFASARVDASGTFTYWAGRPQSVPFTATGGPKYAVYDAGTNASSVTGSADTTTGKITIDVPVTDLGGIASGSRLIDVAGITLVDRPAGVGSTTPALADQADVTQTFDDSLSFPITSTPEVPWAPLILLLGGLGGGIALRLRERNITRLTGRTSVR